MEGSFFMLCEYEINIFLQIVAFCIDKYCMLLYNVINYLGKVKM